MPKRYGSAESIEVTADDLAVIEELSRLNEVAIEVESLVYGAVNRAFRRRRVLGEDDILDARVLGDDEVVAPEGSEIWQFFGAANWPPQAAKPLDTHSHRVPATEAANLFMAKLTEIELMVTEARIIGSMSLSATRVSDYPG